MALPTTMFSLTVDAWTEIASEPCDIETKHGNNAYICFADSAPAIGSDTYHDMVGPASYSYTGSLKTFARASHGSSKIVVSGKT